MIKKFIVTGMLAFALFAFAVPGEAFAQKKVKVDVADAKRLVDDAKKNNIDTQRVETALSTLLWTLELTSEGKAKKLTTPLGKLTAYATDLRTINKFINDNKNRSNMSSPEFALFVFSTLDFTAGKMPGLYKHVVPMVISQARAVSLAGLARNAEQQWVMDTALLSNSNSALLRNLYTYEGEYKELGIRLMMNMPKNLKNKDGSLTNTAWAQIAGAINALETINNNAK